MHAPKTILGAQCVTDTIFRLQIWISKGMLLLAETEITAWVSPPALWMVNSVVKPLSQAQAGGLQRMMRERCHSCDAAAGFRMH